MKKAFITITSNCYSSQTDFDLLRAFLRINGWQLTQKIGEADLLIINTCAFILAREDEAMRMIGRVREKKKINATLIITGCLPAINPQRIEKEFRDVICVPAKCLPDIAGIINAKFGLRDISLVEPTGSNGRRRNNELYKPGYIFKEYRLRIGWGCRGKCSYCVIRRVFGKPRSRPENEIIGEFSNAVGKGYKKFVLAANETGVYGEDTNTDLAALLEALCGINKEARFSISNITPDKLKNILPRLGKFLRKGRIWRINVPVQSGSDRILSLMNRPYSAADFRRAVGRMLSIAPGIMIETDIMAGFPSETGEDFHETVKLVEWLAEKNVVFQIFPYCSRPHTAAANLPGQISEQEKQRRCEILHFLCSSYFVMKDAELFDKWRKAGRQRDAEADSASGKAAAGQIIYLKPR